MGKSKKLNKKTCGPKTMYGKGGQIFGDILRTVGDTALSTVGLGEIIPDSAYNSQDMAKVSHVTGTVGKMALGAATGGANTLANTAVGTVPNNGAGMSQADLTYAIGGELLGEDPKKAAITSNIESQPLSQINSEKEGNLKVMFPNKRAVPSKTTDQTITGYSQQYATNPDGTVNYFKKVQVPIYANNPGKEVYQNLQFQAYGGELYADGGMLSENQMQDPNQLTQYEGPTHEQGGIALGNTNNEVEGGETRHEDYIFSDRILVPDSKLTFSEMSKRIENRYKKRENDSYAQKAKNIELKKLRDSQDAVKNASGMPVQGEQQFAGGGPIGLNAMQDIKKLNTVNPGIDNPRVTYDENRLLPVGDNSSSPVLLNSSAGQMNSPYTMISNTGDIHNKQTQSITDYLGNFNPNVPDYNTTETRQTRMGEYAQGAQPRSNFGTYTPAKFAIGGDLVPNFLPEHDPYLSSFNRNLPSSGLEENVLDGQAIQIGSRDNFNPGRMPSVPSNTIIPPNNNPTLAPNTLTQNASPYTLPDNLENQPSDNRAMFNDQLTPGEKAVSFLPSAVQALNLIGGPEKDRLDRYKAERINLEPQRNETRRQGAQSRAAFQQSLRNAAPTSGAYLTNLSTGNVGLYGAQADQLNNSYLNQENANTQIGNQEGMTNVQIANTEKDINSRNRAAFDKAAIDAATSFTSAAKGVPRDNRAYASNNMLNNIYSSNLNSMYSNYQATPQYDAKGRVIGYNWGPKG